VSDEKLVLNSSDITEGERPRYAGEIICFITLPGVAQLFDESLAFRFDSARATTEIRRTILVSGYLPANIFVRKP
jgi:hypothetical protein